MGNMSYCRFRNTLQELEDCWNNWDTNEDISTEELRAREKLLKVCEKIVDSYKED